MQYRTTSDSEGEFDTYWFEKNLHGDIVAVYNDAGTLLVKYVYDAWGNTVSTTYSNGGASTIVRYNRFRYRGYYYDTETGFYYLNSRYYDPSTGRFINADSYASTGQGLIGNNMYAYCLNNPVMCVDANGNWCYSYLNSESTEYLRIMSQRGSCGGGTTLRSALCKYLPDSLVDDMLYYDVNNTSDQRVLDANYFSAYKGKLVIKLPWEGRPGSFGAIFLTQDHNNVKSLRHEYGHTIQLEMMGLINYSLYIAIPSINNNLAPPMYYNEPCEITADILGGVDRYHTQSDIAAGYDYLFSHINALSFLWFAIRRSS